MYKIILLIVLFLAGCAPAFEVSQSERTRLYDADMRTVFEGAIDYLTDKGYRFDVFDIDRGLIRTAPTATGQLNTRVLPGRYITTVELTLDDRNRSTVVRAYVTYDIDLGGEIRDAGLSYRYQRVFYDHIFKGIAAYSL